MNNAEHSQFEQHLATVALQPTADRQQAIMYECGRAAGRAELRMRLRAVITTCAVLLIGLAGFNVHLLTRVEPELRPEIADHGTTVPLALSPSQTVRQKGNEHRFRLRVGFRGDVLETVSQQWTVATTQQTTRTSQKPLTATSWGQLDEPWN